jgi:hypothetical protein
MKKYIVIMIAFLICGCATTEGYKQNLTSWMGANINDVVNSWGYPTKTFKAPNGNTVYLYQSQGTPVYTTTAAPFSNALFGNYKQTTESVAWCNTFFEVDDSSTIINWRFQGNACKQ